MWHLNFFKSLFRKFLFLSFKFILWGFCPVLLKTHNNVTNTHGYYTSQNLLQMNHSIMSHANDESWVFPKYQKGFMCVIMVIKHTHTHARTHAHTHACTHTYTHTHTHVHTHTHTHTHAHTHTHTHTRALECQCLLFITSRCLFVIIMIKLIILTFHLIDMILLWLSIW